MNVMNVRLAFCTQQTWDSSNKNSYITRSVEGDEKQLGTKCIISRVVTPLKFGQNDHDDLIGSGDRPS